MRPIGEQSRQVGLPQRRLDEAEARLTAQARQIPLLQCARVVIRKAIDPDDIGPVSAESIGQR